ncbi:MAG: hypothetical protein PHI48_12875 [Bacteroidales bacterium]|nr:hypothetical protein [Bacteroidales bacterium]
MKRNYKVFFPSNTGSFSEQVQSTLESLQMYAVDVNLLFVTVFVASDSDSDFFQKKKEVLISFQKSFPEIPLCVLAQAPADNSLVALEICYTDATVIVNYKRWNDQMCYTIASEGESRYLFSAGLAMNVQSGDHVPSLKIQSESAFSIMQAILSKEEFSMDHVIRQWNYIPRLVEEVDVEGKTYQNYQIFNEIRQKYYSYYKKKDGYPAATGIGSSNGVVTISFIAVSDMLCEDSYELSNPNQIDAYNYGQEVLIGDPLLEQQKKTPLFERGKVLCESEHSTFFISGTASILGQETVHVGDVAGQTEQTIQNITSLMSPDASKSAAQIIDMNSSKEVSYLRVYIKDKSDFPVVRQICENQYGADSCINYVEAEVCRTNLLVEIEGEFIAR